LLYLKLERFSEAVDDLETYLRLAPDAADAEEILEQVLAHKNRPAQVH
jgi:regulator of sirC expression with transglutaminase-like and TPR domain